MDDPNTFFTPLRMSRPFSPGAGGGGGGGGLLPVGAAVVGVSGSFGLTCTMNVNPSGTERAIVVTVAWQTHGALPTSVQFKGSENFTLIGSDTSQASRSFAAYILLNPSTGAGDVVVTFAGTGFSTAVAQCMSGAHQTTPTAGWATTLDQANSTMSHTIAGVNAGEWTFDVVSISDADGAGTTQEADQTSICSQGRGVASGAGGMGSSYNDADTGTVTFDWDPGFVCNWSAGKFRLLPV